MTTRTDVLVVGAGPVGLMLACQLQRLGVSVRLIEKRSGPSVHSKAIGLQYRVSEVLAQLGIVERFVARGGSPTVVNLYAGHERLLQLHFIAPVGVSGRDGFAPRAIMLPQAATESILIDHLRELGGAVEWDTELIGCTQRTDGVTAEVRRGGASGELHCDWLVSCEGAHSIVRKRTNITFSGKTYPLAFVMADVRMEGTLLHGENHVWLHPDGSLAALPLPDPGTWRLFVEVTRESAGQGAIAVSLDSIRRLTATRAPDMDARIVGEPLWLSDFRINCRMVDRMRDGRIFLAGDSAHIHSPTGGQGITTGMQDAANLGWKLARVCRGGPTALLSTYGEERLPHAAEVLRQTDRTTRLMFAPNPILRLLRDRLLLPILRSGWVQRRMFGKLSQLHVHYRRSSLSRDCRPSWQIRGIRAGDRAPDVAFSTRDGVHTTLFTLLHAGRPLALLAGMPTAADLCRQLAQVEIEGFVVRSTGAGPAELDGHTLADRHGDFAALYRLGDAFICLIRPDGHVGFVSAPPRMETFRSYLERLCHPAELRRVFGGPKAR